MREWNDKINLISRKDIEHLEERHLAHCLAITNHLKLMQGARVMDVGTGGGFPGLIMAICYPQAQFTLVDSIGKKIAVVVISQSAWGCAMWRRASAARKRSVRNLISSPSAR